MPNEMRNITFVLQIVYTFTLTLSRIYERKVRVAFTFIGLWII